MLEKKLQQFFGYSSFRPGQKEIIEEILKGRNVLGVLPTGSGKSICYQLPSLLLPGLTIVISPLIALMEDQVYQLRQKNLAIATFINSHISYKEYIQRWDQIEAGKYNLLYVSPEKLRQKQFLEQLKKIKISLFVIDEAHCISEWGHDFRTDYLRLKDSIRELDSPPVLCLTATATSFVRKDIINQLELEPVRQIITTFDRPNIAYQVIVVDTMEEKKSQLENIIERLDGPGIIYVNSRLSSETIAHDLKLNGFWDIEAYHAGLSSEDRMIIQQQFMNEELRIIVATKAFGMGIDKTNVNFVIHFDIPTSIESYVQETGRVSRNGEQGVAILLYQRGNEETALRFIEIEYPEEEQLIWVSNQIAQQPKTTTSLVFNFDEYSLEGLTEEKMELILFYFEKEQLISWRKEKNQFVVDRTSAKPFQPGLIMQYFFNRKKKRKNDVERVMKYVLGDTCRREQILRYFEEELIEKSRFCCDRCGFDHLLFAKEKPQRSKLTVFNWQNELDQLLPLFKGEAND